MSNQSEIHACGGVIVRYGGHDKDQPFYALVHRPRYGDWSFPKGKLEPGEQHLDCALREVYEETGYKCKAGQELASTHYADHLGRHKTVRYWLMEITEGNFSPNEEVDTIAWLPFHLAEGTLTYPHDKEVLNSAQEAFTAGKK
jgi:8-oxo-dGTP diphosphatase